MARVTSVHVSVAFELEPVLVQGWTVGGSQDYYRYRLAGGELHLTTTPSKDNLLNWGHSSTWCPCCFPRVRLEMQKGRPLRAIFAFGLTDLRFCFYTKNQRRNFHTACRAAPSRLFVFSLLRQLRERPRTRFIWATPFPDLPSMLTTSSASYAQCYRLMFRSSKD